MTGHNSSARYKAMTPQLDLLLQKLYEHGFDNMEMAIYFGTIASLKLKESMDEYEGLTDEMIEDFKTKVLKESETSDLMTYNTLITALSTLFNTVAKATQEEEHELRISRRDQRQVTEDPSI